MERLEISIIHSNDLNAEHRFDAEYFSKHNIQLFAALNSGKKRTIGEFCDVTDGIHTSIDYDDNSPINLISATSPRENYFNLSRNAKISEKAHEKNPRTALRLNDVILSTVGTIGNCAVVDQSVLPANADRHVGIIRVKKDYSPYVVSSFLLSKYGKMQTFRETTGNVQPNLFLYKIREIMIPEFSNAFQEYIERLAVKALEKRNLAQAKYSEAEAMLLQELDMDFWQPEEAKFSIRSLKNIFHTERIDAEYYQQKYDNIKEKIKSYGYLILKEICHIYDTNYIPEKNVQYHYIELSNIGNMGEVNGYTVACGSDLPTRARRTVHKGNIVLSSIEGSLPSCALISDEFDHALCSSGFYIIDSDRINSETLLVLMKSWPMQAMMKQACSGTILTAFGKSDLENIPIPIIKEKAQKNIAGLVNESIQLRKECKDLLEQTKLAVETAIEQGEDKAFPL